MPEMFAFASSGEAYNASQCDDRISDGDILLVPSEGSAGVLVAAWPAFAAGRYDPEESAFHGVAEGQSLSEIDGGKYAVSAAIASQLVTAEGALTEAGAEAVAASEARAEAEYQEFMNQTYGKRGL